MKVPVIVGKKYISFVSDLGVHGEGIGKIDGFTVFIPDALPEEIVKVKINSERPVIFDDVLVRVKDSFRLAMHIDYDEANAAGYVSGVTGTIIKE